MNKDDINQEPGDRKEENRNESKEWINKAEAFIDETAEKIHESDAYRETGKVVEAATKKLFREAGKWWGKTEHYFNKNK